MGLIFALMENISTYALLLAVCGLVILSYFFSILNRMTRVPSVLLLLGTGILLRYLSDLIGFSFIIPQVIVEFLGTIGLIMIVLEAGLDLEITRERLPLIRRSFLSALVIFLVSSLVGCVSFICGLCTVTTYCQSCFISRAG